MPVHVFRRPTLILCDSETLNVYLYIHSHCHPCYLATMTYHTPVGAFLPVPKEETLLAEPPCRNLLKLGHHLLPDNFMTKKPLNCKSGKEEVFVTWKELEKGLF